MSSFLAFVSFFNLAVYIYIGIKKAINQTALMAEIGLQALTNISQIVNFLKIEELHALLEKQHFPSDQPGSGEGGELQEPTLDKQNTEDLRNLFFSKRSSEQKHVDPIPSLKIQEFISRRPSEGSGPILLEPHQVKSNLTLDRNEEYYINQCPLEFVSILLKLILEFLLVSKAVESQEQLPEMFLNVLEASCEKSDSYIETEIFGRYLEPLKTTFSDYANQLLDQTATQQLQIEQLVAQIQKYKLESDDDLISCLEEDENNNLSSISALKSRKFSAQQKPQLQPRKSIGLGSGGATPQYNPSSMNVELLHLPTQNEGQGSQANPTTNLQITVQPSSQEEKKANSGTNLRHKSQVLGPLQFSSKVGPLKKKRKHRREQVDFEKQQQEFQKEMEATKAKHKEFVQQLAAKIILLEEQLDAQALLTDQKAEQMTLEQEIMDFEELKSSEMEKIQQGILGREGVLNLSINRLNEEVKRLEIEGFQLRMTIEEQSKTISEQKEEKVGFDYRLKTQTDSYQLYQKNVGVFLRQKCSLRTTFCLAFEQSKSNSSMMNEQMIKIYLSKALGVRKEVFQVVFTEAIHLSRQDNQKSRIQNNLETCSLGGVRSLLQNNFVKEVEQQTILKIYFEVTEDEEIVSKYFQKLKNDIKEGISILFDLQPLFLGLNLGSLGLKGKIDLSCFSIIDKRSLILNETDLLITLLKSKENPFNFVVYAQNPQTCSEYILELDDFDTLHLLEGQNILLEGQDHSALLVSLMLESLALFEKDQQLVLTCQDKVFFSTLFQEQLKTKRNQTARTPYETNLGRLILFN